MPRRRRLTDRQVATLARKPQRYTLPDSDQPNLVLRVPVQGPVSYTVVVRRDGRQIWKVIGTSAWLSLPEARDRARDTLKRIHSGLPLEDTPRDTLSSVAEKWLKLVVHERNYRTAKEYERIVHKFLIAELGDRAFAAIRRSDIAALLDDVAENSGRAQSDQVLKVFGAIASWWAKRDDTYRSPVVAGMRRGTAVKRDRVLNDDELRAVWHAADGAGSAGAFIQFALLCGQRYAKIASMCWDDLSGDTWTIRQATREKGTAGVLRLPPLAMAIIQRQPHFAATGTVFGPVHNRSLARLRAASGVEGWTIHDCRRCWRTWASRAGVSTEIAELTLGHSLKGVRQVYDRHQYTEQKARALTTVAQLIETILSPPAANVVTLGAAS